MAGKSKGNRKTEIEASAKQAAEPENIEILARVGLDITALAQQGKIEKIAGWDEKIDRLEEILQRRIKHHIILLGPEGSGKRSIVFGLAEKLSTGDTTDKLRGCRIIELNLASMAQLAPGPDQFPKILFAAFQEALQEKNQCTLVIHDFHVLLAGPAGAGVPVATAHILRTMMEQTQVSFVICTTKQSFDAFKSEHEWLPVLSEVVEVDEPNDEVLSSILTAVSNDLGRYHALAFDAKAIELAGTMARRFSESGPVAGFAVRLLDESAAKVAVRSAGSSKKLKVKVDDVAEACAKKTGLSLSRIMRSEALELLELEDILKRRVKGQDEAVAKVAGLMRVSSLGLEDRRARPAGVLMFVGPSGVGKTELAKALTEARYGSESKMVVVNMAQYADDKGLPRLLGTDEDESAGTILTAIESNPHSVLLLKEIETSNVMVGAALSEFFGTGTLYGRDGREISFPGGMVILTVTVENLLEDADDRPLGFWGDGLTADAMVKEFEKVTKRVFPPEFLESLDEIVFFRPLEKEAVLEIAELRIRRIANSLEKRGIRLEVSTAARDLVAERGSSKKRGMKNLAKALDGVILRPVSSALLADSEISGIKVDAKDGEVVVETTGKAKTESRTGTSTGK
jgi:ATP-dependent Clp protease ATP-binding subunit ClpC